ncbi:MAG: hypothetical protein IPM96_16865 [Ignavibacteria bacterium]|nr:hypothetical protein [Ignavibacteria bacterium]
MISLIAKNDSEKETAKLFSDLGITLIELNWKMKDETGNDEGEIDGIFLDEINKIYLIYDVSYKEKDRQEKIVKFLTKWKNHYNQSIIRKKLNLKNYPIYVLYIDRSNNKKKIHSIKIHLDKYTKIIYSSDYNYFSKIFDVVGDGF